MSKVDVLITGGYSMIGRAIAEYFTSIGLKVYQLSHNDYDLTNFNQTYDAFREHRSTYCIHCAGYNGNIQFNQVYPADIFYNTACMALNVLKVCTIMDIQKVVSLISSCAYPSTNDYLQENNFWNGKPDDTVNAHGFSKRIILEYGLQLSKQNNLHNVCMICNTVYGPYDSYKLEKTKVVGAVIKKLVDAKYNNTKEVVFWGDGSVRRELIYSKDVAKYCLNVLYNYNDVSLPINIGTGTDITIKELVELVKDIVKYTGTIKWDITKPNGQYRKILDVSKMCQYFDYNFTPLNIGLSETIDWYQRNRNDL